MQPDGPPASIEAQFDVLLYLVDNLRDFDEVIRYSEEAGIDGRKKLVDELSKKFATARGRASGAVRSQAEPWNEIRNILLPERYCGNAWSWENYGVVHRLGALRGAQDELISHG